ncbi:MAG: hypothetical protein HQK87_08105 [Nitrospinae bacterium]|nr:hypothetical protein [Nitrospinota bacterium]
MRSSGIAVVAVILSLALSGPAMAAASFESAETCQPCHGDIYRNWRQSLHALSFTNPVFAQAYQTAYTETAGEAKKQCLPCHAPTATVTGDFDARQPVTREGITCDFCHSVTGVDLSHATRPFELAPGKVKRSVLKDARAQGHEAAYSADFASSKLCAGCHGMTSRNGLKITDTYNEWKGSSFARAGKVCQSCHMAPIPGKTANEGGRESIHNHSLSRNLSTMKDAVSLEARILSRTGESVGVEVRVTNERAGHAIPTGAVARKLLLEVSTVDGAGQVLETKQRVYRKVVVDADGAELLSDGEVFLKGDRIVDDNRLRADETRTEQFSFRRRAADVREVRTETFYIYEPTVAQKVTIRIPLSSATTTDTP